MGPPFPEGTRRLHREHFDTPYFLLGTNRTETVATDYGLLVSSWSGYALERTGAEVTPFVIPALDVSGRTNVACGSGAVRLWVTPSWTSASLTNGTGPGVEARLVELVAVGQKEAAVVWSLQVNATGTAVSLVAPGATGPVVLLTAEIAWAANEARLVTLNYGPGGTELFLEGALAAEGAGTLSVPPRAAGLVLGSTLAGTETLGGFVDEVYLFAEPLTAQSVWFYWRGMSDDAARGPVTAAELAAEAEWLAKLKAEWEAAQLEQEQMRFAWSEEATPCLTNGPVYLTNIVAALDTNSGWTVLFTIQGGTNGLAYDIFSTTNLVEAGSTNAVWVWEDVGYTCNIYFFTNQPEAQTFYLLGTPLDSDRDGLTDAYERLVSQTNPNVWSEPDTDGDGLPDAWELAHGSNPQAGDPAVIFVAEPKLASNLP